MISYIVQLCYFLSQMLDTLSAFRFCLHVELIFHLLILHADRVEVKRLYTNWYRLGCRTVWPLHCDYATVVSLISNLSIRNGLDSEATG